MENAVKILAVAVFVLVGFAGFHLYQKNNKPPTVYQFTITEIEGIVSVNFNDLMLCKGFAMQGRKSDAKKCWLENYEKTKEGSRYQTAVDEFFKMTEEDKSKQEDPRYLKVLRYIDMNNSAKAFLLEATK